MSGIRRRVFGLLALCVLGAVAACSQGGDTASAGRGGDGGGGASTSKPDLCNNVRACIREQLGNERTPTLDDVAQRYRACSPSGDAALFRRVVAGLGELDPEEPLRLRLRDTAECPPE